jgi:hypothetical protein
MAHACAQTPSLLTAPRSSRYAGQRLGPAPSHPPGRTDADASDRFALPNHIEPDLDAWITQLREVVPSVDQGSTGFARRQVRRGRQPGQRSDVELPTRERQGRSFIVWRLQTGCGRS